MASNLTRKYMVIFNVIMALAIFGMDILYMSIGTLLIKGVTSGLFFVMGLVNFIYAVKSKTKNFKSSLFLLLGLFFAMLGDIILNINFVIGATLFGIGHILFFVSYCSLIRFKWFDILYGIAIFVPSMLFIVLSPLFDFEQVLMEAVCIAYALVISFMLGKSISNLIRDHTILNLTIFIGSVLFFFSDLMLLLNVFAGLGRAFDILCLLTYYPAEIVLALSIFVSVEKNENNIETKQPTIDN